MARNWIESITGSLDGKRRWRAYTSRKAQLPGGYRAAIDGLERYLMYSGSITNGDVLMRMNEDLLELFEGAVADGTAIRDIVGDDPVEFADTFMQNYRDGQWIARERARLNDAIDRAVGETP
ncbi:DUF1048 domain-containing protein [Agrococcus sp. Ld7]|uniref:DUF1048 domain-containing protein n=1 Tax=Agrococcus sp. Ld7 TaxID=649148 RepID=UPI003865F249